MSREATLAVLDHVLPEYERISKAPEGGVVMLYDSHQWQQEYARRYKSVNDAGDILLIQNPAVWRRDSTGYYQPKPELKMTRAEVAKAAGGKQHGDRMANHRTDEFSVRSKGPWNDDDNEKVRHISRARKRRDSDDNF